MIRTSLFALAAMAMTSTTAIAQERDMAVDVGIGTTGIRANLQWGMNDIIVLRGGYNYLKYDVDGEEYDGVSYDGELDFSTIGAFVDVHPLNNGFTLTAGVYQGGKDVNLSATPTQDVMIGDLTYTPSQIGTLSGGASLEDTAPYVGIGWDNALYSESRFNAYGRLGVMFTGSPDVTLDASGGTLNSDPTFQQELAKEEQNIEDDLTDYELYPVISVGMSLRL